jgi:cation:H+ antiporter
MSNTITTIVLPLLGGLALLAIGGELLVRGAVQAAERLGVSPLVIGLTLVGFGTSTPELVTSVQAAMAGSPGIAVGNIVGSNIANILLILGVSAIIYPIMIGPGALWRDGNLMVAVAVIFALISYVYMLDRLVGVVLIGALCAYVVYAWRQESQPIDQHTAAYDKAVAFDQAHDLVMTLHQEVASKRKLLWPIAMALAGLVLVVLGGRFFVDGAVTLARGLGVSETVIGLTIVAIGTSMPELITSVIAAIRRQADVALGNVLGSNIYNILGIGGVTAVISPTSVPREIATFDNLVMVAASVLLMVVARSNWRIGRFEGAALVAAYVAYVAIIWP